MFSLNIRFITCSKCKNSLRQVLNHYGLWRGYLVMELHFYSNLCFQKIATFYQHKVQSICNEAKHLSLSNPVNMHWTRFSSVIKGCKGVGFWPFRASGEFALQREKYSVGVIPVEVSPSPATTSHMM